MIQINVPYECLELKLLTSLIDTILDTCAISTYAICIASKIQPSLSLLEMSPAKSGDVEELVAAYIDPQQLDSLTVHLNKLNSHESCIEKPREFSDISPSERENSFKRKLDEDQYHTCVDDSPDQRASVPKRRRNALIPNGIEAEILKDVCLLFHMETVSFSSPCSRDSTSQKSLTDYADDSDDEDVIIAVLDSDSDSDNYSQLSAAEILDDE